MLGVSFGGLVAQKLNEIIHPQQLILVSTFAKGRSPSLLYKVLTTCRINTLFSPNLFSKFGVLNSLFFGVKKTEDKELLKKIILDTNRQLFVWATCEIVKFKPLVEEDNFVAIHGKKDLVIPNGGHDTFEINDAGHLAVLTHANLVKTIIYEHVIKRPI